MDDPLEQLEIIRTAAKKLYSTVSGDTETNIVKEGITSDTCDDSPERTTAKNLIKAAHAVLTEAAKVAKDSRYIQMSSDLVEVADSYNRLAETAMRLGM
jgi:hypothetical protein